MTGQLFSVGTPDSSTNKTDHNTKTTLLLEVVLNNNHKKSYSKTQYERMNYIEKKPRYHKMYRY